MLSFSRDEGGTFSPGQLAWALEEPGYYPRTNDTIVNDKKPWVPFWVETTQLLEDNDTRPARAAGCQVCLYEDFILNSILCLKAGVNPEILNNKEYGNFKLQLLCL